MFFFFNPRFKKKFLNRFKVIHYEINCANDCLSFIFNTSLLGLSTRLDPFQMRVYFRCPGYDTKLHLMVRFQF